jgi:hypothetical protein
MLANYEWRPLDQAETVSVKDGKLWTDFGENMDEEYFPLGSETFFVKNDLGSVTFVRDAQGHVTGYSYHRWDGQEIHAKKIKKGSHDSQTILHRIRPAVFASRARPADAISE